MTNKPPFPFEEDVGIADEMREYLRHVTSLTNIHTDHFSLVFHLLYFENLESTKTHAQCLDASGAWYISLVLPSWH